MRTIVGRYHEGFTLLFEIDLQETCPNGTFDVVSADRIGKRFNHAAAAEPLGRSLSTQPGPSGARESLYATRSPLIYLLKCCVAAFACVAGRPLPAECRFCSGGQLSSTAGCLYLLTKLVHQTSSASWITLQPTYVGCHRSTLP